MPGHGAWYRGYMGRQSGFAESTEHPSTRATLRMGIGFLKLSPCSKSAEHSILGRGEGSAEIYCASSYELSCAEVGSALTQTPGKIQEVEPQIRFLMLLRCEF